MLSKFYLSHRSMKLQNKCISTYHTLSFSTNSIAWMRYWLIREISFLGPILKHIICFFIFGRFNHHGSVFRNYFWFMMIFSKMRRYNIILRLNLSWKNQNDLMEKWFIWFFDTYVSLVYSTSAAIHHNSNPSFCIHSME